MSKCSTNRIAIYDDSVIINFQKEHYSINEDDSTGTIIKKLRLQRGLSGEQLSRLIGIKAKNISNIELNKLHLTYRTIRAFYKVFKDDIKIDNYTKYVLSDANIKFCKYIKEHNMKNYDLCNYLGVSQNTILQLDCVKFFL